MIKKIALGILGAMAFGLVAGAYFYPQDFVSAIIGLIIGLVAGYLAARISMENDFYRGASMANELHKQQVVNPATFLRETRLAVKDEQQRTPKQSPSSQEAIPQFSMTGLDTNIK